MNGTLCEQAGTPGGLLSPLSTLPGDVTFQGSLTPGGGRRCSRRVRGQPQTHTGPVSGAVSTPGLPSDMRVGTWDLGPGLGGPWLQALLPTVGSGL